jgi:ring-1,2-phenylacetyl-CoA epoxidase subunit PaaD
MTPTTGHATVDDVRAALAHVHDPEYPGVSIVDLGLLEGVRVDGAGHAEVDLIPTFSGCPALHMIARDVEAATAAVPGVSGVTVTWLTGGVWSPERLTPSARATLARDFTVVLRRRDGTLLCPVCGSVAVIDTSGFGPTRCRSLAWCPDCRNPVEVLR